MLPPSIAVVAHEMFVFLQLWIVVRRKHFSVRIDIYARSLGLSKQIFDVVKVVPTDEDSGILSHADVHPSHLRVSVSTRVSLVQ